jgi:hypothetical protein
LKLLDARAAEVEVGVTHHKLPGGAWGQYAVLFVVFENGAPVMTARPGTPIARSRGSDM